MISFFICLAILIIGYFTYGKVVEKTFGPDDRETPAVAMEDGVDYVTLPEWRIFLIQLLNIAGLRHEVMVSGADEDVRESDPQRLVEKLELDEIMLIPAALLMSSLFGVTGVWLSFVATEAVICALSLVSLRTALRAGD